MKTDNQVILIGYTTRLFADSIESMIESFGKFTVVEKAKLGNKLLSALQRIKKIDIVVIELCRLIKSDLQYFESLRTKYPHVKILLLSHMASADYNREIINSGINAYILKTCSKEDFITALNKLVDNKFYYCSDITKSITNNNTATQEEQIKLTLREKEILSMLVNCKTNYQIAEDLGLSENTIKTHRKNILTKFGTNNLLGMVRYACRSRLLNYGNDEFCTVCPHCSE